MSASSARRVPRRRLRVRTVPLERRQTAHDHQAEAERPVEPPYLIHPVIVGYDGSPSARNALAYAAGTARQLGRPLLMVYVAPTRAWEFGHTMGLPQDTAALELWLLSELDQVTDSGDLDVHVRTRWGNPPRELAAIARELRAEALVIGVPRHFWHQAGGSVSGWLARHPRCPVIVVP